MSPRSEPQSLLIVGPSWLGDAVMMGALVERLKTTAPERRITVMTPPPLQGVVRRLPGVDDTLLNPFGHGALKLGERAAFGRSLKGRFDEAIVLPHSWKSALAPFFAGIRRRTGFVGEARYGLLNDARRLDEAALPRMVDRFCLLAEPRRGQRRPAAAPAPRLAVEPGEIARTLTRFGLERRKGAVALCIGAEYGPAKRWPIAQFAALARRLKSAGFGVWALGGPSDVAGGTELAARAPFVVDLTGRTSLVEALHLIAASRAVVSNDSGLMHVAAALGRPLVAVYGSSSPEHTPPLSPRAAILREELPCSPCFARVCPLGHLKCLTSLAPERVFSALSDVMAKAG